MKKVTEIISIAAFFIISSMFMLSTLFFQNNVSLKDEKQKTSSVKSYAKNYFDDNFPLQSKLKSFYIRSLVVTGRNDFDGIYVLNDKLVKTCESYNQDKIKKSTDYINDFSAKTSVPVYFCLAPTAAGIYSAQLPSYSLADDQHDMINKIYNEMNKRITNVDIFYPLYSAKDNYIFYNTEDCWTSLGAYYAYNETAKALGLTAVKMINYDREYVAENLYGSLFSKVSYSHTASDRISVFRSKYQTTVKSVTFTDNSKVTKEDSVYFDEAWEKSNFNDVFLEGDKHLKSDIVTNVTDKNAPTLLIIKSGFANTIVPFLTPHYSKITLIDPVKLKASGKSLEDTVNIRGYSQIMFMFDADSFSKLDCLDIL